MASAAFPQVIAAITSKATFALNPTRVVRGQDLTSTPGDVVLVGIRDAREIEDQDWSQTGAFNQEFQSFGGSRRETGTVNGLILAKRGSTDMQAAEEACFAILATIEAFVRADPTLGLNFDYMVAQTRAGNIAESQANDGATCSLGFAIDYDARI